jgi:hypothetical protein
VITLEQFDRCASIFAVTVHFCGFDNTFHTCTHSEDPVTPQTMREIVISILVEHDRQTREWLERCSEKTLLTLYTDCVREGDL